MFDTYTKEIPTLHFVNTLQLYGLVIGNVWVQFHAKDMHTMKLDFN